MDDYTEPTLEATAEEVDAAARALHEKWQQPPIELVVPPPGVWSKLEAARATYSETPMDRTHLVSAFPTRFSAQTYREEGDMTTATANALEIAYKSGLFGRAGASIEVLTRVEADGAHSLLIIGTIFGKPSARTFEIAREGKWSYGSLLPVQESNEKASSAPAPRQRNLTRALIFLGLTLVSAAAALVAFLVNSSVLGFILLILAVIFTISFSRS